MYRIAVLTDHEVRGQQLCRWVRMFSEEWGLFPSIEHYENPECFFYTAQKSRPDGVIVEISGVSGLNTVEHLRSLYPCLLYTSVYPLWGNPPGGGACLWR